MAIMEADRRNPKDAVNAAGAMINRAAKSGQDLGEHVSRRTYQPTIEPAQQRRLASIIGSPQHNELTQWVERRATGQEADPVNGATHFLAPPRVMLNLERQNPSKYKNWGPRGANWTGYDPSTGQYRNTVLTDNSHHFLAPEGAYSARGPSATPPEDPRRFADLNTARSDGVVTTTGASAAPPQAQQQVAGREVIPVTGGDMTGPLQEAYGRGNRNMLYINDSNPRVIARAGEPSWSPRDPNAAAFSGPKFANQFLVQNDGYNAVRDPAAVPDMLPPMARGGFPDVQTPAAVASGPGAISAPAMSYPSAAPSVLASQSDLAAFNRPRGASAAPPPGRVASFASPGFGQAQVAKAPQTTDLRVAASAAAPNTKAASEQSAGLSGPPAKFDLGGSPQFSGHTGTNQVAEANDLGSGRAPQRPEPAIEAPTAAGRQTQTASAEPPKFGGAAIGPAAGVTAGASAQPPTPETRMALGGPAEPEGTSVKTRSAGAVAPEVPKQATRPSASPVLNGVESLIGNLQKMIGGGMGRTSPTWNMDASNPGVRWSNNEFSSFGWR